MIIKRFIPLMLQLTLAVAGQQLMLSGSVYAQEQAPADAAVAPAAEQPAAAPADTAGDQATSAAASAQESTVKANPYGLGALWEEGDMVAKGTLVLLLIMSAGTWFIIFTKLWEQQGIINQAKDSRKLWEAASLAEGVQKLNKNSVYRALVEDGLNAMKHHDGRLTDKIDMQEWVTMTVQRGVESLNSQLQGGLAFLATTGSTGPFIGLFGTVWGIYHALVAIGIAGQASIDKVAGPVGEALIMTAIGLAVAVPAVLGYNFLVRRNKLAMEDIRAFAGDVHAYLLMGSRVADQGSAAATRSK
ncbi:MAG TPA: MotA/TolQ/ExbB proton channel family protein [Spongiibacteraceae bacterium]|nr:MotA/TolQ/ExbB proton channel family protein [Spongiibacteraceae bacterium]